MTIDIKNKKLNNSYIAIIIIFIIISIIQRLSYILFLHCTDFLMFQVHYKLEVRYFKSIKIKMTKFFNQLYILKHTSLYNNVQMYIVQ